MRLALHWQIFWGMLAGAILGVTLNLTASSRSVRIVDGLPGGLSVAEIDDTSGRAEIRLFRDGVLEESFVVDPADVKDGAFRSVDELRRQSPVAAEIYSQHGGSVALWTGAWLKRVGSLFLRMLQMVAVPLIITSLGAGILGLGDRAGVGGMFTRTLAYYAITSFLAILTGLLAVNVIRPGLRGAGAIGMGAAAGGVAVAPLQGQSPGLGTILFEQLEALIPSNPVAALAEPNFLSIIAFTIAIAIFALRIGGDTARRLQIAAQTGCDVMMAMTTAIIKLAPLGVFFLMAYVTATQGVNVFKSLAWYVVAVAVALAFHACVTLPLILRFVAKVNPREFARAMSPALLMAFSSASSNGTLPLTMSNVEKRAGISKRTGSFVLPLGATVNMDGTALYEVVAVLFIAQLHNGANLPLSAQVIVAITALLASVGAAGIPHAGLVMMVIILQAVGLPIEMQAIILAVDRVLDMARTAVNVWSDSCGCAVVERLSPPAELD